MTKHDTTPPDIPVLLPASAFEGAVYNPISSFVTYVNALLNAGFTPDMLPPAFHELYLLDYYDAQVRNGGHSQFIHNSHGNLHENLQKALNAARWLDLPEMAALLEETQQWIKENPQDAAQQDGFENRAAVLDPKDKRLYAMTFSEGELQDHLSGHDEEVRDWWAAAHAETDFYAHNKYHVVVGIWLLKHPSLQRVNTDDWRSEMDALIAAHPEAAHELAVRILEHQHDAFPDDTKLALANLLRREFDEPQFLNSFSYAFSDLLAQGHPQAISITAGERSVLRKGNRLSLHTMWSPARYGAKLLVQIARSWVSGSTWLKLVTWSARKRPGRAVAHEEIDPHVRLMVCDLHVPEALALWGDAFKGTASFAHGALVHLDTTAREFEWLYEVDGKPTTLRADPDGVHIARPDDNVSMTYPVAVLQAYRAQYARPGGRKGVT